MTAHSEMLSYYPSMRGQDWSHMPTELVNLIEDYRISCPELTNHRRKCSFEFKGCDEYCQWSTDMYRLLTQPLHPYIYYIEFSVDPNIQLPQYWKESSMRVMKLTNAPVRVSTSWEFGAPVSTDVELKELVINLGQLYDTGILMARISTLIPINFDRLRSYLPSSLMTQVVLPSDDREGKLFMLTFSKRIE